MKRIALVLGLLVIAAIVAAQSWEPISSHQTGPAFTTSINDHLSGVAPIQPSLACFPFPYLPAEVIPNQLVACYLCAATNPCSLGTSTLLARGIGTGIDGQWNCDQTQ